MATTTGQLNDTADFSRTGYFVWHPDGSPLSIRVHPDVMDGIARDVLESRTAEVGGLLLGSVDASPERPVIRIERYHRIPCTHTAGAEFVLDATDRALLEKTAAAILESGDLSAVGVYRSHLRPGFQIEPSDSELIDRYFQEAFDLVLLIKPDTARDLSGQFFVHSDVNSSPNGLEPVGPVFPYRFHQTSAAGDAFAAPTLRPRRLISDFTPDTVKPAREFLPDPPLAADRTVKESGWKKWWPLPASLLAAGAMLWMLLAPQGRPVPKPAAPAETKAEAVRPLGLYATKVGDSWQVSWNPNATALHDARSVQLFVREGDDQNRIQLSPQDIASATYAYKPSGNDVTFRLEVTESSGQIAAESYRFIREIAPPAPSVPAVAPAPKAVPPRAVHKVPPTVPAGMKPRIKTPIPIDVRVEVDARGRVVSAAPVRKYRAGVETYLADRAVDAAKQWRFEPNRPGEQTIRFLFGK